jgi:hypothetical protein
MQTSQSLFREEWRVNLLKDGGRCVMNGGNAYEDDLEPESGPAEPPLTSEQPPAASHG